MTVVARKGVPVTRRNAASVARDSRAPRAWRMFGFYDHEDVGEVVPPFQCKSDQPGRLRYFLGELGTYPNLFFPRFSQSI
jgi:hypothetical protein